uniref:NADH-plastoquinone oxidoreductase subunit 4 n=1 Tax=Keteleeria davidiana TaxID=3324 RepID=A0A8F5APG1_KETDA|nr:NADH-plastoquinone oxidoreductase subunit 4 [Keteleeria davidiana]
MSSSFEMASLALPEICGFVAESIRSSSRKK